MKRTTKKTAASAVAKKVKPKAIANRLKPTKKETKETPIVIVDTMPKACVNYTPEELSQEIYYISDNKNQGSNEFSKRLANLYAYSFLNKDQSLFQYLEERFKKIEVADKTIQITFNRLNEETNGKS